MDAERTFRIAFWVLFGGLIVMRACFFIKVRQAGERLMPDREAIRREGRWVFAMRVVGFFLLIGIIVSYVVNSPWMQALAVPFPGWLRWIGFVPGIASLMFWTWVQQALGTQWSAQLQLREEHQLVTSGPYARVRHPLYTAMCGWAIALALVTANWLFVAIAVLSIALLSTRIGKEEQMMIEEFGDEYRGYMKRTGRLLPKF